MYQPNNKPNDGYYSIPYMAARESITSFTVLFNTHPEKYSIRYIKAMDERMSSCEVRPFYI